MSTARETDSLLQNSENRNKVVIGWKKIDIMGLSLSELEEAVVAIGEKKFRAKQITSNGSM